MDSIPIEFIEKEVSWYETQMEQTEDDFRETLLISRTALLLLIMKWRHKDDSEHTHGVDKVR